jgi:hypothetical protein
MNEIVKRNDSYVARYDGGDDPYLSFAREGAPGIVGRLLTNKKGVWGIGKDEEPVPAGALYLALVPSMRRGMLKWVNRQVVDARMGAVSENYLVPHRYTLGDLDRDQWERGPKDEPIDPWKPSYQVQLVELSPPHGDLTFSSGSYGAKLMCQELCLVYRDQGPADPDIYPVIALTTKTRQSKEFGKIPGPWFDLKGWATVEDVRTGRKAGASTKKKKKMAPSNDDEPAGWGNANAA